MPVSIFISYSHNDLDRPLLDKLLNHLRPKVRSGRIKVWDDSQIPPGAPWDDTIKKSLASADIVVFLVSAEFNSSDYIWRIEMTQALERAKTGQCRVIPVLLRACDYSDMPYTEYEMIPKEEHNQRLRPVSEWADQDNALTIIVKRIDKVSKAIEARHMPSEPELLSGETRKSVDTSPDTLERKNVKRRFDSLLAIIQELEEQLDITRDPLDRLRLMKDLERSRKQFDEVKAKLHP